MKLNENSIIYSGGVGEDMSFDLLLLSKYNCNIFLIDPTTKAIKHFDEVKKYCLQEEFKKIIILVYNHYRPILINLNI